MRISMRRVVPFLLVVVGLVLAYTNQASASTTRCRVPETSTSGKVHLKPDSDCDLLSNRAEHKLGTNPRNADTDADSLTDGEEVQQSLTDPLDADSDDDGLSDGEEVEQTQSDPNDADTDDDGIEDGSDDCPDVTSAD